jgi:hypothetical protein
MQLVWQLQLPLWKAAGYSAAARPSLVALVRGAGWWWWAGGKGGGGASIALCLRVMLGVWSMEGGGGGGEDAASVAATATPVEGCWILSGSKALISGAGK